MSSLRPHEQQVVLLRYLEGLNWAETAKRLGVTEDTAQKRGSRALSKLQRFVGQHGLTLSLTALTAVFTEQAVAAVPLPAVVTATAAVPGAGSIGLFSLNVASLYQGVLHTMKLTKIAAVLGGLVLTGTTIALLWARPARASQDPQQVLSQVRDHYQGLSSFSMTITHEGDSGLYAGRYVQQFQWRRGSRFALRVTSPEGREVPNFYANGTQVMSIPTQGARSTMAVSPQPNSMPGWEVSGGEILGWLQDTPTSHSIFSPPPGMALTWSFGPRTVWHGSKVRELLATISNQGHSGTMSLFVNPAGTALIGHEGGRADGEPGYALFRDQQENGPLPTTLGNAP